MTLADGIEEIYKQYGYFMGRKNHLCYPFRCGRVSLKSRKSWINLRGNAPQQFNNTDIAKTEDFLEQTATTADGVEN